MMAMRRNYVVNSVLGILVFFFTSSSFAEVSGDAQVATRKLLDQLSRSFTQCGDSIFTKYTSHGESLIFQVREFKLRLLESNDKFDKLETLNGYQWQGKFELSAKLSRAWGNGTWGDWFYGLPSDLNDVRIRKFLKKNGEWSGDWWVNPVARNKTGVGDVGIYFEAIPCSEIPAN